MASLQELLIIVERNNQNVFGLAPFGAALFYWDVIMKSNKVYSILLGSLGLLAVFIYNINDGQDNEILSAINSEIVNDSPKKSRFFNDNAITEDKLAKIIKSIELLQKNIENQSKKFNTKLALLKNSQIGVEQVGGINQIEEDDEFFSLEEKEQLANEWYKKTTETIGAVLAEENIDEKWTNETQQRLEVALEASGDNLEIQNISCGGSICKLNAEFKKGDMSSGPNIDHLVYGDMEWDGPILSKYDADTGEVTVFLMRSGVEMTDFEPGG